MPWVHTRSEDSHCRRLRALAHSVLCAHCWNGRGVLRGRSFSRYDCRPALDTRRLLGNVILNVYNFGADHDVYWDNFQVRSATPAAFLSAITGQMTIAASDVTVDGFYLTNPAGKQAIYAQDRSDITIKNNIVTNVGSSDATTSGTNFGMAIVSSAAAVDGITITDNRISQIVGGNKKSADGIAIGWSTGNELITGLLIKNNTISNITSDIGDFSPAAGARTAF